MKTEATWLKKNREKKDEEKEYKRGRNDDEIR